jgi:predicted Rdx family selenoprotein
MKRALPSPFRDRVSVATWVLKSQGSFTKRSSLKFILRLLIRPERQTVTTNTSAESR